MIQFDHVGFSRGDRVVLRGISFSVNFDERVAILGGSGAGKTTILKLIMGLLRPDFGNVIVDGEDITTKTEDRLREVRMKFSIVFQEGALFDSLNVKENVAFYLREYTKMTEKEIENKVKELLSVVGLGNAMELMPEELSGGMHRRVAIARSLAACNPRMFLYDEPTSALDPENADIILNLIIDLSKNGKGFVLVSHEVHHALKVAGRFMFLKDGVLVFDGDKDAFLHSNINDVQKFVHRAI